MKIIIALSFLAMAAAVPMPAVLPEPFLLPEAAKPYLNEAPEAEQVYTINFVDSPTGESILVKVVDMPEFAGPVIQEVHIQYFEPIDISPLIVPPEVMEAVAKMQAENDAAVKVVYAPADEIVQEAPAPYVYLRAMPEETDFPVKFVDSSIASEVVEPIKVVENPIQVTLGAVESPIQGETVKVVEAPLEEPSEVIAAPIQGEAVRVVEAPIQEAVEVPMPVEPVHVVESPQATPIQKIAPLELEAIRVLDAPDAVKVVEIPEGPMDGYRNPMARSMQ